ncbi:MAG: two-component system, sensor histidine kinase RegB [Pelagibacterales bacterium]|nr:two-component system, sensor histidine kinase RegB [Pelagibacterales bacterium]
MKFFETSRYYYLNKPTYTNLRWIGIIGQLLTVNSVKFIFDFKFDFIFANLVIILGIISNLYLKYIYKENYLSNKSGFTFLNIDILQLSFLLYLTGGITNPFIVFLVIPCILSSTNLDIKTNLLLIFITIVSIIFLTFWHKGLPEPINLHFYVSNYYYYSVPLSLSVALIFLNYFGLKFGAEARIRKEALNKMEEIIAKEHELLSLGGQAAAAAHSFGTPLSTIKIISQDLLEEFKDNKVLKKDIELLISQVNRCNNILKKLTLNPIVEDDFINKDITIQDYIIEIVKSFEEISAKKFVLDFKQNSNHFNFFKSIEIAYGLRNFIGNANKFANKKIYISIKSDTDFTEVIIEDDGKGFSHDILYKIGEPYIRSLQSADKLKSGLGLGIFIGKTLLEKNHARVICRNSKTRGGAEVIIKWKNNQLKNI